MIHYRFDSSLVSLRLIHVSSIARLRKPCNENAAIMFDKIRPEELSISDCVSKGAHAAQPSKHIDEARTLAAGDDGSLEQGEFAQHERHGWVCHGNANSRTADLVVMLPPEAATRYLLSGEKLI